MTNNKSTKRALFASAMALLLCFSMLLGTTYAWFTDSVTSAGNKIVAGTLDVDLYMWNSAADSVEITENSAPIFGSANSIAATADNANTLWEPGKTQVAYLSIKNNGNLDLKYQVAIEAYGERNGLLDVLSYSITNDAKYGDVDAWAGNGVRVLAGINATQAQNVVLKAGQEHFFALSIHMDENAGNEYQEGSASFDIKVLATQLASESDSFDNQYDANAPFSMWDGTVPAEKPASLVVDTANKLISINDAAAFAYLNTLVNDANFYDNYGSKWHYSIELNSDIDLANNAWTPIQLNNFVSFDGNGHTIKNLYVDADVNSVGLFASITCNDIGRTYIKNFTISNAFVSGAQNVGVVAGDGKQALISSVTVENATVIGDKYIGGIFGHGNGAVKNSIVKDSFVIIPEGGAKEAGGLIGYLANDGDASSNNTVISGNIVENVTVSAPTVASALVSQPNSANSGTAVIVVEFNTVKNVTVTTADDTADIFVSNNVGGKSIVANNTEIGCTVNKAGTITKVAVVSDASELKAANDSKVDVVYANNVTFSEGVNLGSIDNATFVECNFEGNGAWKYANNVTYENCTFDPGSDDVAAIHFDRLYGKAVIRNCTFVSGKVQIGTDGSSEITFENCTFEETASTSIWGAKGMRVYCPATFISCEFNNRVVLAGSNGLELVFDSCTMNGGSPVYYVDNNDGIIRGGNIPAITIK